MAQSQQLRALLARLKALEKHFLPRGLKFPATGVYSQREEDQGRAYVLLVHAELESYFEDRTEELLTKASIHWQKHSACNKLLRRLLRSHLDKKGKPWEPIQPVGQAVTAAINFHKNIVNNNQGVKEDNLLQMLFPIGIDYRDLDSAWLSTMNSFGASRGEFAHNAHIKTRQAIDLQSQYRTIKGSILPELKKLDKRINRLA
jgi:hypothetical protein